MNDRGQGFDDEDPEDENQYGEWYGDSNEDGEEFPSWQDDNEPELDKLVRERVEAFETALVDAIERGDTGNKVYKGLQTRLNERVNQNRELQDQLNYVVGVVRELQTKQGEMESLGQWNKDILLDALDEEGKAEALSRYDRTKATREQDEVTQFIKDLRSGRVTLPQQAPQRQEPQIDMGDIEKKIQEAKDKFIKSKRDYAKSFGVDPDHSDLDYGNEDASFFERQESFDSSLLKIINSGDRVNKYRGNRVGSTGGNSGSREPLVGDADDALSKAANERIKRFFN